MQLQLRNISEPRGVPEQLCCMNEGVGAGRTVEHMDGFGLPLCIGPGHRLLHTAPCEQHHKSAGRVVRAGVEGEMEDGEKAGEGKGEGRGILSVTEIERAERGRGGGD